MRDITLDTITELHTRILATEGGDSRVVSEGNLLQIVFQANLTKDPVSRAVSIFWSLCAYPVFREGNRRTAYRLAETILSEAGLLATLPCGEARALIQGIEMFTVEPDDVEQAFRRCIDTRS